MLYKLGPMLKESYLFPSGHKKAWILRGRVTAKRVSEQKCVKVFVCVHLLFCLKASLDLQGVAILLAFARLKTIDPMLLHHSISHFIFFCAPVGM